MMDEKVLCCSNSVNNKYYIEHSTALEDYNSMSTLCT